MVAGELDELLVPATNAATRDALYSDVLQQLRHAPAGSNLVRRDDLMGGLASGWIVFACSFPAVLPFLFMDDLQLALRVSNGILLALLFFAGYHHARHTLAKPWLSGLVFLLVGVFLVAVAIPLGG